ncbi:hypothetical protein GCM10007989_15350 [Devosia pacifica]|uniref:N-acetyltransferase domain-containing protein n=1 Tax=Devosia pacifica TaxID=1335967 RepID=A0A918VSL9_9HYPH|nr:GNAT family N-acetyltransferase [Devosia pacifica]GHA21086.1 hypothetical protein GCM10007989_15350 [Devosia pacifica]
MASTLRPATTPRIRPALDDDVPALIAIDTVARTDTGRRRQIEHWVGQAECLVADRGGTILGYAVIDYSFFERRFLAMLMVAEAARRQRVGRTLAKAAVAASGEQVLWTSCNVSNHPVQALFAAEGFFECGRIEGLDPGDPELIWRYEPGKLLSSGRTM